MPIFQRTAIVAAVALVSCIALPAHAQLVKTVEALPDRRLSERVPGKKYDIRFMLEGVAQHELYHAGQIAILKKAGK